MASRSGYLNIKSRLFAPFVSGFPNTISTVGCPILSRLFFCERVGSTDLNYKRTHRAIGPRFPPLQNTRKDGAPSAVVHSTNDVPLVVAIERVQLPEVLAGTDQNAGILRLRLAFALEAQMPILAQDDTWRVDPSFVARSPAGPLNENHVEWVSRRATWCLHLCRAWGRKAVLIRWAGRGPLQFVVTVDVNAVAGLQQNGRRVAGEGKSAPGAGGGT